MIECIRNKDKYQSSKAATTGINVTPKSRCKESSKKKRRIGVTSVISESEDEETLREAIAKEMSNKNIRIDVLRPLMTATFNSRRLKIGETPIQEMVKLYEPLRLPEIVSLTLFLLLSSTSHFSLSPSVSSSVYILHYLYFYSLSMNLHY